MDIETLISSRPGTRDRLGAWYQELFQAADREGLSIADLATRLDCSVANTYAWRRRLRREIRAEGDETGPTPQLLRVRLADTAVNPDIQLLEVRLRGGRSITVPSAFDPATLASLVKVLEQC